MINLFSPATLVEGLTGDRPQPCLSLREIVCEPYPLHVEGESEGMAGPVLQIGLGYKVGLLQAMLHVHDYCSVPTSELAVLINKHNEPQRNCPAE